MNKHLERVLVYLCIFLFALGGIFLTQKSDIGFLAFGLIIIYESNN